VGALPKRKPSNRRQGNRRSHHRVVLPALTSCPRCHKPRRIYHACLHCGYYGNLKVLEVDEAASRR
jgi:large subunit ribosomal protein L32